MSADKKRESPLAKSALFPQSQPAQPLPPLPTPLRQEVAPTPLPSVPMQPEGTSTEPPLLYVSQPSADWIARPFDRQYDKQALNAHPYLIGAVEALGKLLKMTKTEMYEDMMRDFLAKHQTELEARPDVVREREEKYRKKHHL